MRTWIKLYTSWVFDPAWGRLSDGAFRVLVLCEMLAGHIDKGGELGTVQDLAWHFRMADDRLQTALAELRANKFIDEVGGVWCLLRWSSEQARPASDQPEAVLQRVKRHRRGRNEDVTALHTECNASVTALEKNRIDVEIDKSQSVKSVVMSGGVGGDGQDDGLSDSDMLTHAVLQFRKAFGCDFSDAGREELAGYLDSLAGMGHIEYYGRALRGTVKNKARDPERYVLAALFEAVSTGKAPGSSRPGGNGRNGRKAPDVPDDAEARRRRYIPEGYEELIEH